MIVVLCVLRLLGGLHMDHVAIERSAPLASFVFVSSVMIAIAAFANLNPISSLSLRLATFVPIFVFNAKL